MGMVNGYFISRKAQEQFGAAIYKLSEITGASLDLLLVEE